ncbi:MAG: pyridoxamine 5'-phosphate oxidase family protein [Pyramidobacter sp.]|jgi:nitroimidazol reductase NimA-like FMN-containing flavoprotein (pyridoxamine 5'-phosphate oxidase superfamily)
MFREMRRIGQQLSEEECLQILETGRRGTLALLGDDAYPYAVPVNYWYSRKLNCLYFHGAGEGHKVDAIRRCGKASFNVLSEGWQGKDEWWMQFNSVIVFGRIRIVEETPVKEKVLRAIGGKYYPDPQTVENMIQKHLSHICILELRPEHITGKHVNEK